MTVEDTTPIPNSAVSPAKPNSNIQKCKYCGNEYYLRGQNDPGYCNECEQNIKNHQYATISGPLYNQYVG